MDSRILSVPTTLPLAMSPSLLLHSLTEMKDLVHGALEAAQTRTVVEIGSESGANTRELLRFVEEREGQLWCVEPEPTIEVERLDEQEDRLHLVRGRSPEALTAIEACDAYIIDGDHNYWTVSRELDHIAQGSGRLPLVILHDVCWPGGRRDMYYAPDALPAGAVHPHSWQLGSVPDREEAVEGGFRGRGGFAIAVREGGERNGVRTAVEDFVETRRDLRFALVPVIFGLGFLYSATAPYAESLDRLLGPFERNPLLERLERNRIDLYLELLKQGDVVSALGLQQGRLLAEYDRSLTAAEAEAAALRLEVAKLREKVGV